MKQCVPLMPFHTVAVHVSIVLQLVDRQSCVVPQTHTHGSKHFLLQS